MNIIFMKTLDDRFIMKMVNEKEIKAWQSKGKDFALSYFNHMASTLVGENHSSLVKILGVYSIQVKQSLHYDVEGGGHGHPSSLGPSGRSSAVGHHSSHSSLGMAGSTSTRFKWRGGAKTSAPMEHFIVMENLFHNRPGITHRFDLKGALGKQRRVKTKGSSGAASSSVPNVNSASSAADDDGEGSLGSGIVQSERASIVGGVLPTSHLNLDGGSGGGSRGEGDDGTGAAAATGATTGAAAVAAAGTAAVTASVGAAAAGAATTVPPLEGGAGIEIIAVEEEKEEEVAAVLQDVNFMEFLRGFPLVLSKEGKLALIDAVRRDTNFLARGRIMDYSLLIGFDAERNELVVGIIDYLRRSVCA